MNSAIFFRQIIRIQIKTFKPSKMDRISRETIQVTGQDQGFVILRNINGDVSQTIIVDIEENEDSEKFINIDENDIQEEGDK